MATRKVPAYFLVPELTQIEEDALVVSLLAANEGLGTSDGGQVIFNTTLNKTRIWNGTSFGTGPMTNPDGGTWNSGGGSYDGNPATINQDSTHRFATDAEKTAWNAKQAALGFTPANESHTHAESDITNLVNDLAGKSSTSHNHAGVYEPVTSNLNKGYTIKVQALTSSPTDAQTIYFGMLPKAPVTAQGTSKIYIRAAGTIKRAEIYCYSGTAGTNESWSIYIRLNNSGDTLIATVGASTSERVFSNTSLNIAIVAGDYIEIKSINPTWATNPLTCIFGGYIYIE